MSAARWGIVIRVVDGDEAEISERCDSLVSRLATLADESLSYPVGKLGRRRSSEEPGRVAADGQDSASRCSASSPGSYWQTASAKVL